MSYTGNIGGGGGGNGSGGGGGGARMKPFCTVPALVPPPPPRFEDLCRGDFGFAVELGFELVLVLACFF